MAPPLPVRHAMRPRSLWLDGALSARSAKAPVPTDTVSLETLHVIFYETFQNFRVLFRKYLKNLEMFREIFGNVSQNF